VGECTWSGMYRYASVQGHTNYIQLTRAYAMSIRFLLRFSRDLTTLFWASLQGFWFWLGPSVLKPCSIQAWSPPLPRDLFSTSFDDDGIFLFIGWIILFSFFADRLLSNIFRKQKPKNILLYSHGLFHGYDGSSGWLIRRCCRLVFGTVVQK
jgi:hypothetical protein